MKKLLLVLPLLAACQPTPDANPPAGFSVADEPIPEAVLAAVPADVRLDQIVARDGCYYVFVHNQIRPVVTAEMRASGFDNQPYCIG